MGKKKKKKKVRSRKEHASGVEERIKAIKSMKDPDENPFKKDNESKIERWRPLWRRDNKSLSEKRRLENRQNRKKKPQGKKFF